jgi:arylsulfatase A-like enzyme
MSPARTGITVPNCHLPQVVLEATAGKSAAPHQKATQPNPVTRLKTEYRTMAETLKDAGYATGHFGKWHLGSEPYSPFQHGFDVDVPHHPGPGPAGSFVAPWKFADFDHDPDVPDQHIEDRMAKEAVAFMEKHASQPFFLNYWMFSVHAPFDAKKSLIEKHRSRVNPNDPQRSPTYAAMIESMDDAIGTLLDTLDRLNIADKTIVVFTSDNGGNMYSEIDGTTPTNNAPLRGGKATMYEGGTRVPCVIAWPGVTQPGSRSDVILQSEDYYPTLLEGLGLKKTTDQRFDGTSILPALKGNAFTRGAVVQYFPHNPGVPDWLPPAVSVHRGDWKLIRIFHGGDQGSHGYRLFNLREDISETKNLASQNPDLVKELDGIIHQFLEETHAVLPMPNPAFDPSKYQPELEGKPTKKSDAKQKPGKTSKSSVNDDSDPALKGWKARGCTAKAAQGILRVSKLVDVSFLGFSANRHSGPSSVTMRIQAQPGESHIDWLPGGTQDKAQSVAFKIESNDWQEITVAIPASGPLGIVRVYLPKQATPIEIDWIEIVSKANSHTTRSDF